MIVMVEDCLRDLRSLSLWCYASVRMDEGRLVSTPRWRRMTRELSTVHLGSLQPTASVPDDLCTLIVWFVWLPCIYILITENT